jgi:hypothetical protein
MKSTGEQVIIEELNRHGLRERVRDEIKLPDPALPFAQSRGRFWLSHTDPLSAKRKLGAHPFDARSHSPRGEAGSRVVASLRR